MKLKDLITKLITDSPELIDAVKKRGDAFNAEEGQRLDSPSAGILKLTQDSEQYTKVAEAERAIQAQIENPLAQRILKGDFIAGDRVIAKLKRDALVFEKERLH